MTTDAPVLPQSTKWRSGRNYPLGGIRTGPAWRVMWQVLGDAPGPIWLGHLERIGAAAGGASGETMKLMLDRFRQQGILHSEKELVNSRWQLLYFRADQREKAELPRVGGAWLAEWCERKGGRLSGIDLP